AVRRGLRSALCLVSTEARPIWVSALSRVDAVLGFLRSHQAGRARKALTAVSEF
ncbi:unnamed protein product, partial [Effrenium voratum]